MFRDTKLQWKLGGGGLGDGGALYFDFISNSNKHNSDSTVLGADSILGRTSYFSVGTSLCHSLQTIMSQLH